MNTNHRCAIFAGVFPLVLCLGCAPSMSHSPKTSPPPAASQPWHFAASGDSRNCGDVVMPAIAASATKEEAAFYWHLGDLRKISAPDEDYIQEQTIQARSITIDQYEKDAWSDFIQNQIDSFGSLPFFLGIGNHETTPPKTRDQFVKQFSSWLDRPELRDQRLKDDPQDSAPRTYYHWVRDGIDFINLDNASHDQFDAAQLKWFEAVIARDAVDTNLLTVVVGMHEALPESISASHSMNEWEGGQLSGRAVYLDLLRLQNESHKKVYVLASHSHYFMDGIFNTDYWRTHGGVLSGWIIGTAGAMRYPLPPNAKNAKAAKTNVYGYLLATVNPPGTIRFEFKELGREAIPPDTVSRFTASFVDKCFAENRQ
jgi:hypothetical protein